jgi:predicted 2-oxoglutarate/Fe(II)-dependent dioxygenase YbiX
MDEQIDGYTTKYNLTSIKQMLMLVGILNGIFSEACQFTEYKKGQFYDWHCDSYEEPYNNPENANMCMVSYRKLSMTVSLTDPNEYEGWRFRV